VPSEEPGWENLGHAFLSTRTPERDAMLQPPKPTITPPAKILEFARSRDAAPEAAD